MPITLADLRCSLPRKLCHATCQTQQFLIPMGPLAFNGTQPCVVPDYAVELRYASFDAALHSLIESRALEVSRKKITQQQLQARDNLLHNLQRASSELDPSFVVASIGVVMSQRRSDVCGLIQYLVGEIFLRERGLLELLKQGDSSKRGSLTHFEVRKAEYLRSVDGLSSNLHLFGKRYLARYSCMGRTA